MIANIKIKKQTMDGYLQSKIWEFGELSFNLFGTKKVDRKIMMQWL